MARGGKWGFSYRRATLFVCSFNIVIALIVLRSAYGKFYANNAMRMSSAIVEYTPEQIRNMEESNRIRGDREPHLLIQLMKDFNKEEENQREEVLELPRHLKQHLTDEILKILRSLSPDANITQQREAVETWRKDKVLEAKQIAIKNISSTSNILQAEAGKVAKALENWDMFSEEIGVWIPLEIVNHEYDEVPETAEEEDILPGIPLPPECHAELHTDYGGDAVRWGLTNPKESAADCCRACLDQAKSAKPGEKKCNIWVYCPSEEGCHSPDIYHHQNQECWLKYAETPYLNFKDRYPEEYRLAHPNAPVIVPWVSGVISTGKAW